MLKDLDGEMSRLLSEIPYPPVAVIALGYRREAIPGDTNLFGFLVPGREKRKILGTLFDSSIYPNRAPEGHVLLRTIVGGARSPETALLDDDKLVATVRSELAGILGIKAEPELFWTYRWEKAIPQYLVGHHARVQSLDERLAKHRGLYLHGNAYRGVAVNDCIAQSFALSEKITAAF
jgi:oxygen-dependent protoporphyrinogen oxidase